MLSTSCAWCQTLARERLERLQYYESRLAAQNCGSFRGRASPRLPHRYSRVCAHSRPKGFMCELLSERFRCLGPETSIPKTMSN